MPYTNVNGTAATVVYYPATSGVPHAFLFNPGPSPAYLGGNSGVTTVTGVPLAPNNEMRLQTAAGTIWGVAGYTQASPYGTINAATTYPGGTTLTVNSAGTAFGTGSTIVVEPGTVRQEFATVFASNAGTVTTVAAFSFGHESATTFSAVTPMSAIVRADRGAS